VIFDEAERIKEELNNLKNKSIKVGLFGQPGGGKSSIINALTGTKVAKPGVENDMEPGEPFVWNGLMFVDLPGFGTEKYPKESYFEKFNIASFDLILCVFEGKWREADSEFFRKALSIERHCLFVRNKCDTMWEEGYTPEELKERIQANVQELAQAYVKVYFTSCRTKEGLNELSEAIFQILEPTKREKWAREAKAYSLKFLQEKKNACEKYVAIASGASAANALNPIPGADVAVDISVLMTLFKEVKTSFGLSDAVLNQVQAIAPGLAGIANKIIQFAAKEGILLLFKQFVGKEALKEFSKYIPFVGQAVAMGAGWAITSNAGKMYLDYCYQVAEAILEHELGINYSSKVG
jgi:GTP-binding protein EngB required for normal cell division/uncharacterized protein (DUF697 family)